MTIEGKLQGIGGVGADLEERFAEFRVMHIEVVIFDVNGLTLKGQFDPTAGFREALAGRPRPALFPGLPPRTPRRLALGIFDAWGEPLYLYALLF